MNDGRCSTLDTRYPMQNPYEEKQFFKKPESEGEG